MYAAKNLIEKTTSLIRELRALHKLDNKNLDIPQIEILQYIAAHPNLTTYNICKENGFRNPRKGKDIDKRWIGKRISQLAEIGLIERIQEEASQRKKLPCRLTITGLVYLFLSKEVMQNDTIIGIAKYYSNNALFQLFVYPYINQDTLQRLTSLNSLSPLSMFLYECCRQLINDVYRVDASKNKYLTEELFVWHTVPDNKHATNTLREFLKRELNLKWMDYAKFEKIDDGGTLKISYKNDSILIRLGYHHARIKALLTMQGREIYEFIVIDKPDRSSEGHFVLASKIGIIESAANFLIRYTQSRVPSFVFNLMQSVTAGSDDLRILSQDKTFRDTLEKTKKQFNNKCEILAKMRSASLS